uniref:Uncharacterized protein n=1 Tax=virus sp. ctML55 TaxID=2827627 RepID=A0A8S5RIW9_9VIRU|nr:MAG TPA: hypothetical protein [virus sp. ctML55]
MRNLSRLGRGDESLMLHYIYYSRISNTFHLYTRLVPILYAFYIL